MAPHPRQLALPLHTHGGRRPGAGRKPGPRPIVPRVAREALASRFPVHVTLRVLEQLPSLREEPMLSTLLEALDAGADRLGMRVVHYSVQGDHLHLIVEARDATRLQRAMQGLSIRIAKALNRLIGRKGKLFADRYHARILRTPREVRIALVHVLGNAHEHALAKGRRLEGVDPCSSGPWFDGWREGSVVGRNAGPRASVPGRTWLLLTGWRRYGLLDIGELAGAARRGRRAAPPTENEHPVTKSGAGGGKTRVRSAHSAPPCRPRRAAP
jgi:REP element-mobilizing transposase RayT